MIPLNTLAFAEAGTLFFDYSVTASDQVIAAAFFQINTINEEYKAVKVFENLDLDEMTTFLNSLFNEAELRPQYFYSDQSEFSQTLAVKLHKTLGVHCFNLSSHQESQTIQKLIDEKERELSR